ncbi:MAG: hypothetical protein M9962_13375 [Oligoflexia bacterium]|nr:hypothetical protein [Oligoflexia bacterium]
MNKITTQRFVYATLVTLLTIIFFAIFYFQPHWGLMDDASLIYDLVPTMRQQGIFNTSWQYAVNDISGWGMFRPLYPLMAFVIYLPGILWGSTFAFLWNACISILVLIFSTKIFAKIFRLNTIYVLVALACFFYQYDWFQHPSLQEKIVLFLGTVFCFFCDRLGKEINLKLLSVTLVVFILGVGSKASFMIYYSIGFWIFIANQSGLILHRKIRKKNIFTFLCLLVLGIFALSFFAYISSQGAYTKQYDYRKIIPNLFTINGVFFMAPILIGAVFNFKNKLPLIHWTPIVGVCAFLVLFLPWGISAYIQSIIGVIYSCLLVQIIFQQSFIRKERILIFLCLLSVMVCGYRSTSMFVRLHDLGKALEHIKTSSDIVLSTIWMPCDEGAHATKRYLLAENKNINIRFWSPDQGYHGKVFLYDSALCSLPNRVHTPAGCISEEIFTGVWNRSFRMAKFSCE